MLHVYPIYFPLFIFGENGHYKLEKYIILDIL